ncbi:MAG: spore germination protein GerW family protein [Gammaproteobacteria bacterium]
MDESQSQDKEQDAAEFVPAIGAGIGRDARAGMVYGEPVQREGVTVVPVAKIRYGFGGGRRAAGPAGAGGGGGARATPMGYIEIRDGQSSYHPIHDPATRTVRLAVGGVLGLLALRAVTRLLRR